MSKNSNQYKKMLCDGVIISAGYTSSDNVILHTSSKEDAEWLYSVVDNIAETRNLDKTGNEGYHREYYLNEQGERVTKPIYSVSFIPTNFLHQRMMHWVEDGQKIKAPKDFEITPTIAEIVYRAGAHELQGEDAPYIEFEAVPSQKLEAELQNLDVQTTNVGSLWRMDEENSARYRAYADINPPNGGD